MKESTKRILDKFNNIQPNFKVQRFIEFPCPWVSYGTEEFDEYIKDYGEPNHREILKDEIVIDVDSEDIANGRIHAKRVKAKLIEQGYKFKEYESGGDGIHFHLIFPEFEWFFDSDKIAEDAKYLLIDYILGKDIMKPDDLDSHICTQKKKLIQIEHVKHRKGGSKKLIFQDLGLNSIPPDFFSHLEKHVKRKMRITDNIISMEQPDNLNCIRFLQGETIEGVNYFNTDRINYRSLFALASYHYNKTKDRNKTKEILKTWYDSIPLKLKRASVDSVNNKNLVVTANKTNGSASCLYRISLLEELNLDEKVCKTCPYYMYTEE